MDPQKAPQGTSRGGSQALPESPQGPPGTFPSTPADALGAPKAAPNPPKTLSRCFKSFQNAKEGAQSLPNATQEAPKPQSTLKINENQTFFILHMAHPSGFLKPSRGPQGQASGHLGTCKDILSDRGDVHA